MMSLGQLLVLIVFKLIPQTYPMKLAEQEFTGKQFYQSSHWKQTATGNQPRLFQCATNPTFYMNGGPGHDLSGSYTLAPHYKIIIQFELLIIGSWDNEQISISLNGNIIYSQNNIDFNDYYANYPICTPIINVYDAYGLIALELPIITNDPVIDIVITTDLDEDISNESYGIRSLLIYIFECHETCKKCQGTATYCVECYPGAILNQNNNCKCPFNQHLLKEIGCVDMCPLNYSVDLSNVCVVNQRISQMYSLLASQLWETKYLNTYYSEQISLRRDYIVCDSVNIIGPFNQNQGISIPLILPIQSEVMIDISMYLFDVHEEQSRITLYANEIVQGYIIYQNDEWNAHNTQIYSTIQLLSDCQLQFKNIRMMKLRIQLITQMSNVQLNIIGAMKLYSNEQWGISHVDVQFINCTPNCRICLNIQQCAKCDTPYNLYQFQCVESCPIYTIVQNNQCISKQDQYPYSTLLENALFDITTTKEQVESLFDSYIEHVIGANFKTGQYYAMLPEQRILGGFLNWNSAKFSKNYNQLPHYGDQCDLFTLCIESNCFNYNQVQFSYSENIIGRTIPEYIHLIDKQVSHNLPVLQMSYDCKCTTTNNPSRGFCGISDLTLISLNCHPLCQSCLSETNCLIWSNDPNTINLQDICKLGYFIDVNQRQCVACLQVNCAKCDNQINCKECLPNYQLVNNTCQCRNGLIQVNQTCNQCDPYCHSCYGISRFNCLSCFDQQQRNLDRNTCICKIGYYEDPTTLICQVCHSQCYKCIGPSSNECLSCVDSIHTIFNNGSCECKPNAFMDTLSQTCKPCKSECESCQQALLCTSCPVNQNRRLIEGHCICLEHYYQESSNQPCLSCHYSCQQCSHSGMFSCLNCNKFHYRYYDQQQCKCTIGTYDDGIHPICQSCTDLQIGKQVLCYANCGDGIVQWSESCDDGNNLPYDGCYQCQFQCQPTCQLCILGKCTICSPGYYLSEALKCERCDIHCATCENSTQCIDCKINYTSAPSVLLRCQFCESMQGWVTIKSECVTICGDSKLAEGVEDCDDGNITDFDGCSSDCRIETDWICLNIQLPSQCHLGQNPIPVITDIENTSDNISQVVFYTLNEGIPSITANLMDSDQSHKVNITLNTIPFDGNQSQLESVIIIITLGQTIEQPELLINFNIPQQLYTIDNIAMRDNSLKVHLDSYTNYTDIQTTVIDTAKKLNKYMLYILLSLTILGIITGSSDIIWNLLDILQQLSYFKYINVQFPQNLQEYFTVFDLLSLDPLFNLLGLTEYLIQVDGSLPILKPASKFDDDGINSLIFSNLYTTLITAIVGLIVRQAVYILNRQFQSCLNSNNSYICRVQIWINHECQPIFKSTIIRMLMASSYDINFAIFLQWQYGGSINPLAQICYILTYFILSSQFYIISLSYQTSLVPKYTKLTTHYQQSYSQFQEGVKQTIPITGAQFSTWQLLKKVCFMFSLIVHYEEPLHQIVNIALLSAINAIIIYLTNPLSKKCEMIRMITSELMICLLCISFVIYSFNDQVHCISQSTLTAVGWLDIGICSLIIFLSLIIDIHNQYSIIARSIHKRRTKTLLKVKQIGTNIFVLDMGSN